MRQSLSTPACQSSMMPQSFPVSDQLPNQTQTATLANRSDPLSSASAPPVKGVLDPTTNTRNPKIKENQENLYLYSLSMTYYKAKRTYTEGLHRGTRESERSRARLGRIPASHVIRKQIPLRIRSFPLLRGRLFCPLSPPTNEQSPATPPGFDLLLQGFETAVSPWPPSR